MSGLLLKDIRILCSQKKFLLVILAIVLLFYTTGADMFFVTSYCSMMGIFLAIGTIAYDEHNKGLAFVFTLPVTRKGYILEKYLFCIMTGSLLWLVMTGFGVVMGTNRFDGLEEVLISEAGILGALYLMLFFMIPIHLKFGAEKSRIATIVIVVGVMLVVQALNNLRERMNLEINIDWVKEMPVSAGIGIGILVVAIAGIISVWASIHIIEKKQF